MTYVLTMEDYQKHQSSFSVLESVSRAQGASLGMLWRTLLDDGEVARKVQNFVSYDTSIYALVGNMESDFDFYGWLKPKISFSMSEELTPFNFETIFGTGTLPSPIEPILASLNAPKPSVEENYHQAPQTPPQGFQSPSRASETPNYYQDDYAPTAIITEDSFTLSDGRAKLTLEEGREYVIGRKSTVDFHITGHGVSREHIRARVLGDRLEVYDNRSANGTRVNGVRLVPQTWVPVGVGSELTLGLVHLRVGKEES